MKSRYISIDLHIHTALSACASIKNTPRRIVKHALRRGLDCIAITDHNTALNVKAVINEAKDTDLLVIPGIEVETREEVHVLTLFSSLEDCLLYNDIVKSSLSVRKNIPEFFGKQILYEDNQSKEYEFLLSQSTSLSLEDVFSKVDELNGVAIPAHIRRRYNGLASILGFIPPELKIKTVELSRKNYQKYQDVYQDYNIIVNSDTHNLDSLYGSPSTALKVKQFDILNVIKMFKRKLSSEEVVIY